MPNTANKIAKKGLEQEIIHKMETALADFKSVMGEKKFAERIRKASKHFLKGTAKSLLPDTPKAAEKKAANSTPKKPAPVKKAPAKKTTAKKAPAKKAAAKKAPAKKTIAPTK